MSNAPPCNGLPDLIRDLEQSYAAAKAISISVIARELAARAAAEQVCCTARLTPLAVLMSPLQRLIGCRAGFSPQGNSYINIGMNLSLLSLTIHLTTNRAEHIGRA